MISFSLGKKRLAHRSIEHLHTNRVKDSSFPVARDSLIAVDITVITYLFELPVVEAKGRTKVQKELQSHMKWMSYFEHGVLFFLIYCMASYGFRSALICCGLRTIVRNGLSNYIQLASDIQSFFYQASIPGRNVFQVVVKKDSVALTAKTVTCDCDAADISVA